jgi:hypothetical protein
MMKRRKDKITALLNAITFAEAGEHEAAKQYLEDIAKSPEASGQKTSANAVPSEAHDKGLTETVRDHMAAVAFAEAGEYQFAESIAHAEARPRSVLFVIDGEAPDANALNYAMSLCKRMQLEMDILQVIGDSDNESNSESPSRQNEQAAARVQALANQLEHEGIPYKTSVRRGDPNQLLYDYAQHHKDVFMVIYDSPRATEKSTEGKMWQKIVDGISRKLAIPLVTVTGRQSTPQTS